MREPLMRANEDLVIGACSGELKRVRSALRRGANANARRKNRTVLLWAVQEGHLNVVRTLVRSGASPNRKDEMGFTPLDQAVGDGNLDLVKLLLKVGAKVNGRTRNGTPLHTACAYRHVDIAKVLLTCGANPYALDEEGRTPADLTRHKGNKTDRALQKLLNAFAPPLAERQKRGR